MNEKIYKILCYIGRVVLPATATLVVALGDIWHLAYKDEIALTIMAIDTFLNALLMIESNKYFEDKEIVEAKG